MVNGAADSRGTCLRVDLSAIAHNSRVLKDTVGEKVRMMAVVKANAYGHGLVPVAKTALMNGASWLGVAVPEEGRKLRQAGVSAPILVLGNVNPEGVDIAAEYGLTQTVFDLPGVALLARSGRDIDVHLKIDTGMNRIGARTEAEVKTVLEALKNAPNLHLTGAFTHFAVLLHAAASDASLRFPWARLHMVREGIALYGCIEGYEDLPLRPAMRLETRVAYIKEIAAGDTVGYGRAFTADHAMRVATLPIGYGDGYPRACSGRASVLLHGQRCRVLGRVCMDQLMVDVSDLQTVSQGDTAVLMGRQGDQEITAAELARWADTISYEILLSPHARVPVIYEHIPEGM